jgi:hypothetical protein
MPGASGSSCAIEVRWYLAANAWVTAVLGETRQYLQDVIRLLAEKPTAREFFDQMIALYPDRLNPGPVWYGALGLLGA